MPNVLINWKAENAYPRLIAALVASLEGNAKIDYNKIAALYGQGVIYNSIEGRFRIIKKEALELKALLKTGSSESTPAVDKHVGTEGMKGEIAKEKEKKKAPKGKKETDKVIGGRVGKGEKKGVGAGTGKRGKKDKGVESVNGDERMEEEEEEDVEDVIEQEYYEDAFVDLGVERD